jgi:Cu(I)/Ag(I) efflux system membrane fusion protein
MKIKSIIINFALILSLSSFSSVTNESSNKWEEANIYVNGVCDMCKNRIEKAALIKGVKVAEWDKHKKNLFIVYRPDKVNVDDIEKAVAKAGHYTKNHKAKNEVYNSLPGCCKYRSGLKVH